MLGAANDKGKLLPRMMFLPTPVKRTSDKAASFLCDNAKYLLGITSEMRSSEHTPSDSKAIKDAGTCFRISAQRHRELLDGVSCPMAQAILRFFDTWQPEKAAQSPALLEHIPADSREGLLGVLAGDPRMCRRFTRLGMKLPPAVWRMISREDAVWSRANWIQLLACTLPSKG